MKHPDDSVLQQWADGELGEGSGVLGEHISGCARCSAVVSSVGHLGGALRLWQTEIDDRSGASSLADSIIASAEARRDVWAQPWGKVSALAKPAGRTGRAGFRSTISRRVWVWPALAAAALLLVTRPRVGRAPRPTSSVPPVVQPGELPSLVASGAEVVRIDVEGAKSYAVMEVPGTAPGAMTAVVWIQDEPEDSQEP